MQVLDAQVAGIERLAQLDIVVRYITVVIGLVHRQCPMLPVVAGQDAVLVVDVVGAVVLHRLVVIEVELQGAHLARVAQVHFYPFLVAACCRTPIGAHILVGEA